MNVVGYVSPGSGTGGSLGFSGDGGDALAAQFNGPHDVAIAPDGTLYVADTDNHCIRRIRPDGVIETAAGVCGESGYAGDGGPADEALLHSPFGVAVAPDGAVIVADTFNHVLRGFRP